MGRKQRVTDEGEGKSCLCLFAEFKIDLMNDCCLLFLLLCTLTPQPSLTYSSFWPSACHWPLHQCFPLFLTISIWPPGLCLRNLMHWWWSSHVTLKKKLLFHLYYLLLCPPVFSSVLSTTVFNQDHIKALTIFFHSCHFFLHFKHLPIPCMCICFVYVGLASLTNIETWSFFGSRMHRNSWMMLIVLWMAGMYVWKQQVVDLVVR